MEICDVLGPDPPQQQRGLAGRGVYPPQQQRGLAGRGVYPPQQQQGLAGGGVWGVLIWGPPPGSEVRGPLKGNRHISTAMVPFARSWFGRTDGVAVRCSANEAAEV